MSSVGWIKRVAVAISGGVDSAVAALLLKRKGYEVHGVFMQNWDVVDETGVCSSTQDANDARWVCNHVGVPFHHASFVKEYWLEVFTQLIQDYESGYTPNPDIVCNRQIKFNNFYKYAREKLGADAICTGHYAQTTFGSYLEYFDKVEGVHLLKAHDSFKDQTFFLSQVAQHPLQRTMFPLGHLTKKQVKTIARIEGMHHVVNKKESMGICFIGSRNFQQFISQYITSKPGQFIDIDNGEIVAKHDGIHHWTIGQRCRIGGKLKPYYIVRKDPKSHEILVASGTHHPSLFSQLFFTSEVHWIHSTPECLLRNNILDCEFRFQHTKALIKCRVNTTADNNLVVFLEKALRAITPGQYAVFYKHEECLGSARISHPGPSEYTLGSSWWCGVNFDHD